MRQNFSSASLTDEANLYPKAPETAPVEEGKLTWMYIGLTQSFCVCAGSGPNVDHLFDASLAAAAEAPKCTIGQRKSQPKKTVWDVFADE